jgi:hypothetical protein
MWRFVWRATAGYRLHPWDSPYLRWRLETYEGVHADRLTPGEFRSLVWKRRRELTQFLRWAARMQREAVLHP